MITRLALVARTSGSPVDGWLRPSRDPHPRHGSPHAFPPHHSSSIFKRHIRQGVVSEPFRQNPDSHGPPDHRLLHVIASHHFRSAHRLPMSNCLNVKHLELHACSSALLRACTGRRDWDGFSGFGRFCFVWMVSGLSTLLWRPNVSSHPPAYHGHTALLVGLDMLLSRLVWCKRSTVGSKKIRSCSRSTRSRRDGINCRDILMQSDQMKVDNFK